jgi:hypothetical protein
MGQIQQMNFMIPVGFFITMFPTHILVRKQTFTLFIIYV